MTSDLDATGASAEERSADAAYDTAADPVSEPERGPIADPASEGPELSVATPLDVPGQPSLDLDRALEAILFVADEPQSIVQLAAAVARPVAEVKAAIRRLADDYDGGAPSGEPRTDAPSQAKAGPAIRRAFELREVGGGWRFYARADYDRLVTDFVLTQTPARLSQAALETLAVIAYKQPVSRGQVASIRAVNVDSVVRTLVGRGLITEIGTDAETGAILYGTTDLLLTQLGINSIEELPKISPLLDDGQDGFDDVIR
ncbi:SMC-Scp complex subunit ScpB [Agromyces seonyuensis]|uniref:SMC-Scp complex subunit ScpB n=1 Tax=Agromyces seonyuensis TaxID=2662446 RepID=A0A6I4P0K3_9MICO|nr:SMC-Scp complex subunit ScpB [Agromyces seonyuensis]MWB99891.1 SMC-Scp complex subunit ScpB [Agromyces seonyuensis]